MLQALQSTRAMLRGHSAAGQDFIEFAVPHTLAFTFFPAWVSSLQGSFGNIKSRLIALNVHDAVMRLVEGSCDVLITYHHPSQPFQLDSARYEMVSLGEEIVAPFARADANGQPQLRLPGRLDAPLPYLGYAPGAYLGLVVEAMLKDAGVAMHLERVYETDMAEGLKAMALEGHGLAFLPQSAIRKELRSKKLVSAAASQLPPLEAKLEIRAYRERPGARESARTNARAPTSAAQALWEHLAGGKTAGTMAA
jgi:DNA-binding transcriptional LysR family regulator